MEGGTESQPSVDSPPISLGGLWGSTEPVVPFVLDNQPTYAYCRHVQLTCIANITLFQSDAKVCITQIALVQNLVIC